MHHTWFLFAAFLGLGIVAGTPIGREKTSPDWLVGTWKLVSSEERMTDGSRRVLPFAGPNGKGYLVYTADGHMCAQIMNPDRPTRKAADAHSLSEQTNSPKISSESAPDAFVAYCGRYEIDDIQKAIYHYPEVAWTPSFVGTKQRRPYTLDGDMLTFSDTVTDEPGVASYVIVWRKVKAGD